MAAYRAKPTISSSRPRASATSSWATTLVANFLGSVYQRKYWRLCWVTPSKPSPPVSACSPASAFCAALGSSDRRASRAASTSRTVGCIDITNTSPERLLGVFAIFVVTAARSDSRSNRSGRRSTLIPKWATPYRSRLRTTALMRYVRHQPTATGWPRIMTPMTHRRAVVTSTTNEILTGRC